MINLNSTQKPKKEISPRSGDTLPPGRKVGIDTSKVKALGPALAEGVQHVAEQVADAKAGAVARELGEELESVKGNVEDIQTARRASRKKLKDARERLEKTEKKLEETEKSATIAEGIAGGHVYAIGEIRGEIEEINLDVNTALSDIAEQDEAIEKLFKRVAEQSEKADGLKECVKAAFRTFKEEIGKAIAKEIDERTNQFEDVREIMEGLKLENKELKGRVEVAEKAAVDASTDADTAKGAVEGALEAIAGIQKTANGASSDVFKLGKDVERLSIAPASTPAAEEAIKEAKGVAKMPPPPVSVNGNKKEIRQMLRENEEKFLKINEEMGKARGFVETLIEETSLKEIDEPGEVSEIGVAAYEGYDALNKHTKQLLGDISFQLMQIRKQRVELKVIYDAVKRLARKEGCEKELKTPATAQNTQLENVRKLTSENVAEIIRNTVEKIKSEVNKNNYLMDYITNGLEKVIDSSLEREGEGE